MPGSIKLIEIIRKPMYIRIRSENEDCRANITAVVYSISVVEAAINGGNIYIVIKITVRF